MKLNCKRIDFTYTPGEEIFNFPEESGLKYVVRLINLFPRHRLYAKLITPTGFDAFFLS